MSHLVNEDLMKELKLQKIWFLWFWGKDKNGNPTKVPISITGAKTGTNEEYRDTWSTYDEAVTALAISKAAGIGFRLQEGYFFLDVDDKEMEHPFIKMLITRFNSYTERFASGNGIHIYGKVDFSKIPTYFDEKEQKLKLAREFYLKNPHNKVEQYIGGLTNRFAVYTEDVVLAEPLKDCTQAILTTLDKDM